MMISLVPQFEDFGLGLEESPSNGEQLLTMEQGLEDDFEVSQPGLCVETKINNWIKFCPLCSETTCPGGLHINGGGSR